MEISLSIAGVLIYLSAFVVYNYDLLRGKPSSAPSRTTWTMWAFLMVLFAITYGLMTNDWLKSLQAFGGLFANIVTCFVVWKVGGTRDFNRRNWRVITVGALAILAWWLTREATWGNILLLLAIGYAMVPTFQNVWKDPRAERPLPWLMFALGYLFQLTVVILRYTQPQDLAAPIVGGTLHLLVGLLALRRHAPKPSS